MNNPTKTWTESGKARKKCDCGLYVHVRVKNCVCPNGFVKTEVKEDNVIKIDLNKTKAITGPKNSFWSSSNFSKITTNAGKIPIILNSKEKLDIIEWVKEIRNYCLKDYFIILKDKKKIREQGPKWITIECLLYNVKTFCTLSTFRKEGLSVIRGMDWILFIDIKRTIEDNFNDDYKKWEIN